MSEPELIIYLQKNYVPDLKKNKDEYDPIDCSSEMYQMGIELKCRNRVYDDMLIEKKKFQHLMDCGKSRYICSDDSGIYSFNVKKIPEPQWFEMSLPETTQFNRKKYVNKIVGLIPKKYGKKI